jgi:hypothetical protein
MLSGKDHALFELSNFEMGVKVNHAGLLIAVLVDKFDLKQIGS